MEADSRVSLVSFLKAKPQTAIRLSRTVLNKVLTTLNRGQEEICCISRCGKEGRRSKSLGVNRWGGLEGGFALFICEPEARFMKPQSGESPPNQNYSQAANHFFLRSSPNSFFKGIQYFWSFLMIASLSLSSACWACSG